MEKASLTIVFFNEGMFSATGESDKPSMELQLTEEQTLHIQSQYDKHYSILSIHPQILPTKEGINNH